MEDRRMLDAHGNDFMSATQITTPSTAAGEMHAFDVDFFAFDATAGSVYDIQAANGSLADSRITVFDVDGTTEWDSHYSSGAETASRVGFIAPDDGTYYIGVEARHPSQTGSYTLGITLVNDDHANTFDQATPLAAPSIVAGEIQYPGDVDLFSFQATAGTIYNLVRTDTSPLNAPLALFDTDGTSQLDVRSKRIGFLAPADGTYIFSVDGFQSDVGSYIVELSTVVDDHQNSLDFATPLAVPSSISSALDHPGDADFFSFNVESGAVYKVTTSIDETLTQARFDFYDQNGNSTFPLPTTFPFPLPLIHTNLNDLEPMEMTIRPTADGIFFVRAAEYLDNGLVGPYTLTIEQVGDDHANNVDDATPIAVPGIDSGNLEVQSDFDYFSFQTVENTPYKIELILESLNAGTIGIRDSSGFFVATYDTTELDEYSSVGFIAPSDGTYFITVYGSGSTGTYSVSVKQHIDDHADDFGLATLIVAPSTNVGELEIPTDKDFFSFFGTAGTSYDIVTDEAFDVSIYGADGSPIEANEKTFAEPRFGFQPPVTGRYYVSVASDDPSCTTRCGDGDLGEYTLSIVIDDGDRASTATSITIPSVTEADIYARGDADFFSFTAAAGESFAFTSLYQSPGLYQKKLTIYDSDGSTKIADPNWRVDAKTGFTAPADGTYFIAMNEDGDNNTGSYVLESTKVLDDHANFFENATSLVTGSSATGELNFVGDEDFFSFNATIGSRYNIVNMRDSLEHSNMTLFDRNGTTSLDFDRGSGPEYTSHVGFIAPSTGTYFVKIWEAANTTGTYSLAINEVVDDHADDIVNATNVTVPSTTAGDIQQASDIDYFGFNAVAGETYTVSTTLDTLLRSSLNIRGTDGVAILAADGFRGGTLDGSRLSFTASANGTHFVEVQGYSNTIGTYSLTIQPFVDDHGSAASVATSLALPSSTLGEIETFGDEDFFSFNATAGSHYFVRSSPDSLTDMRLTLYDTDGASPLAAYYADETETGTIRFTAPIDGTYFVAVDSGDTFGFYTLDVEEVFDEHGNDAASATPIALSVPTSGQLQFATDEDYFEFTATAGEYFTVDSPFFFDVEVLGSDGITTITTISPYDPLTRIFQAPSDGTYFFRVFDADGTVSGPYSVLVRPLVAAAIPVTSESGQVDQWLFSIDATAGSILDIRAVAESMDEDAPGVGSVSVYDQNGQLGFSEIWQIPRAGFVVPSDGTYFVRIDDYTGRFSGPLTVDVTEVFDDHGNGHVDSTPIVLSSPITSGFDYVSDHDFFSFPALAGVHYDVQATTSEFVDLHIYDVDGATLLAEDEGFGQARRGFTPTTDGVYFVGVGSGDYPDESGASVGTNYQFEINEAPAVDDHGNDADSATTVTIPQSTVGAIQYAGDFDFFSFAAAQGQKFDIATTTASGEFDTQLTIYYSNPDGFVQLANDKDSGFGNASRVAFTAPADGIYAIRVSEDGDNDVGDYQLSIQEATDVLTCDYVAPAGCDMADIDALYIASGNGSPMTLAEINGWLNAASSTSNPLKPSASSQFLFGDVNLDGNVDSLDLGLLLNQFGETASLPWSAGNLNGDANVDSLDLGLLLNDFGFTSEPVVSATSAFLNPTLSGQNGSANDQIYAQWEQSPHEDDETTEDSFLLWQ